MAPAVFVFKVRLGLRAVSMDFHSTLGPHYYIQSSSTNENAMINQYTHAIAAYPIILPRQERLRTLLYSKGQKTVTYWYSIENWILA